MPDDRRTEGEIRLEITTEREQLVRALADLREGIKAMERPAAVAGASLGAGLTAVAAFKVIRRLRGA